MPKENGVAVMCKECHVALHEGEGVVLAEWGVLNSDLKVELEHELALLCGDCWDELTKECTWNRNNK